MKLHGLLLQPALALLACAALVGAAAAQTQYPVKPVQVILPLQAGSASDVAVRFVTERLTEALKQSVTVENVPGAAGLIGVDRLTKARADGYTLAALNNSILTILPHDKLMQAIRDDYARWQQVVKTANIVAN